MEAAGVRRGPRPPKERLASIKNRNTRLQSRPAPQKRPSAQARCPECQSTDIQDVEGTAVCGECGVTINDSNIVAEVTFGESAAGAAIVQGGFVGEGQRHARTTAPGRYIHETREPREISEANGRDEIRKQANRHNLSDHIVDQAVSIYKLALNYNFVQGRQIRIVAAVCLYAACRRDAKNQTLLMDLAEGIAVNVFKLGHTWTDLKKSLYLEDLRHYPVIEVENLIMKFARKLEFGNSLMKVAEDAAKLLRRMKRDWMVTGRRPAGLCGACIILAARMNNFRRTVREVVYVVKVTDVTVAKRLEEFGRTDSSNLSVEQFREHGLRLKKSHDPPSLHAAAERESKKQKIAQDAAGASEDNPEIIPDDQTNQVPSPRFLRRRGQPRRDADGFIIPDIPIDPNIAKSLPSRSADATAAGSEGSSPEKPKPGRPRKPKPPPKVPITITEDDLLAEEELEREMTRILNDPTSITVVEDTAHDESAAAEAKAKQLAESLRNPDSVSQPAVSDDPEIRAEEFEDDPEVANCLLSEAERRVKERIWVTHNEDWLRAKQAKMLKKILDDASGVSKKPKRKRAKGRLGDGSVLEGGTPVENAADAARRMLEKHVVNPSKHINYQNVDRLYAALRGPASSAGSDSGTRAGSVAASDVTDLSSAAAAGVDEDGPSKTPTAARKDLEAAKTLLTPAATAEGRRTTRSQRDGRTAQGTIPRASANAGDHDDDLDYGDDVDDEDDEEEEDVGGVARAFGIDVGDLDEDDIATYATEDDDA